MVTNMRTNKPGLLAVYADAKGHRSLDIVVKDGPAVVWNESSISGFEEGMHDHTGGERTSGKVVEVAGIRSYEREGFLFVRGTRISTIQLCITADGKMFLLEAIRSDGEVGDDTEIRQALSSFRFLRTPVQSAVPISPPFNMAAYEMGRKMGYLMGILVMLAVAAAIVYAVVRSIRTTRSSRPLQVPRPQMPPPLPPRLPPDRR
jgi:hypothetical protein